ncbi:amino acid ABC transporter permease [Klebsiella variicola]|nr:amino acid ABC transporter permease [Klebsiella variicola]
MSIDLMWQYFLSPEFIRGAWMTLLITLCSLLCGVVLGLVLALLQEAPFRAGKGLAFFYLWLFRGTAGAVPDNLCLQRAARLRLTLLRVYLCSAGAFAQ